MTLEEKISLLKSYEEKLKKISFVSIKGRLCIEFQNKSRSFFCVDFHKQRPRQASKNQIFSKALGLHLGLKKILDLTAGWCKDSLFAVSLGAQVVALEKNPAVYCMIEDEWERQRLRDDPWSQRIGQNLKILHKDALSHLDLLQEKYEVLYMDPMFFQDKKSLSSKDLQCLETLQALNSKTSNESLLEKALQKACRRVVVKRPRKAPAIEGPRRPSFFFSGKGVRYDVYVVSPRPSSYS